MLACSLVLQAQRACADRLTEEPPRVAEPPVAWAVAGGAMTALLPLAIGASMFGTNDDLESRKTASILMVSGLALAPIVSHLAVKEWSRAGIFGAIPVASAVGMIVLLELQPSATLFGTRPGYFTFGLTITLAVLGSGVGLLDTLGAAKRAADRNPGRPITRSTKLPVLPVPLVLPKGGGLAIGGLF